jgi:hypothetical protein
MDPLKMSRRDFLFVAPGALAASAALPAEAKTYPVRLGVDDSRLSGDAPAAQVRQLFEISRDLGLNHLDIHLRAITRAGDQNSLLMAQRITQIDETLRQHGMTYTLNVEAPNFSPSAEITPGVNEFDHPGGLHRWDLRMQWLRAVLPPAVPSPPAFQGLVYDECGHMQLSNNKFSNPPRSDFDRPFLVDTHGMDLETAYDRLVAKCRRIREEHYEGRVPISTEQVWPDLFHIFANAGWTLGPKLLKESLSSVVISIAMGAALQYSDRTRLWASPDLWRFMTCPGHSAESLRSALLMAYWLGLETIYVEGLDRPYTAVRHPDAVTPGKLVYEPEGAPYQLTAYGHIVREFAREYVPAHPRPITWRDYRPRVAIVRLPDGGWGQSPPDPVAEEYPSRNRLLGNKDMPLDKAASEWLYIWPILTHNAARPGAITIFNVWTYPERLDFFIPIDSVAVFDHRVEGAVLDSVECFIVCGHALSAGTFQAIQARVRDGATCIIARRLYKQHASWELPGKWLLFDSSVDPRIAQKLEPFLGPPDVARFRFAHHTVEFRKGAKPDQIEVKVTERDYAGGLPPSSRVG